MSEAAKKVSALDKIKALSKKAPAEAPTANLAGDLGDPAIAGAKRNKNTVTLGLDPEVTEDAQYCAELKAALDTAKAQFEVYQSKLRDYGAGKRVKYNDAFKADVTTVQVPYLVEVADGDGTEATPGREEKVVQVICTNKYSVAANTVLQLQKEMAADTFGRLFKIEESKVLKPNAEDLVRDLLTEMGIEGEELDTAMDRLFETKVKVTASKDYEQEIKKVDDSVQQILEQAVVRQAPALKFPG
jgi:hypothetical protein